MAILAEYIDLEKEEVWLYSVVVITSDFDLIRG